MFFDVVNGGLHRKLIEEGLSGMHWISNAALRVTRTARRGRLLLALSVAVGIASARSAPPPDKIALVGGRIIPVVGKTIEKGTILMERGKIAAIGESVDVPYDARVFDMTGKTLFPGLIDAASSRGMDSPNEARPITPQLDTADSIDPSSITFEDALRLGVTAIHVVPADNTVIGGLGRVVRPIGLTPTEMSLADGGFMKLSCSPRFGYDRMLQMVSMRETLAELDDYLDRLAERRYEEKKKEEDKPVDVGPAEAKKRGRDLIRGEDIDEEHRNILRLRGGQVKVLGEAGPTLFKPLGAFITCGAAMDVGAAVRVSKEFGFFDRTVLVLGGETHKAVKELKAAARPVVLPSDLIYREADPLTGKVSETFVPKVIADAGLQYAIIPGPDSSLPERMQTYQAARCIREGISRDDAIRAITLNPAKILGIADRLGSLEVGKDATVVVFSGDPLDFTSSVEKVFIDGIIAYERERDVRMKKLLSVEPGAPSDKPGDKK